MYAGAYGPLKGFDLTEFYAHLQTLTVTAGQPVEQGQIIGVAGSSGGGSNAACPTAYDPHLHFAMYVDASYLDSTGQEVSVWGLPPQDYWEAMSSPSS
jgi:murein DD-endopeptidase MepM/ murein hydrolase activator NlpD